MFVAFFVENMIYPHCLDFHWSMIDKYGGAISLSIKYPIDVPRPSEHVDNLLQLSYFLQSQKSPIVPICVSGGISKSGHMDLLPTLFLQKR